MNDLSDRTYYTDKSPRNIDVFKASEEYIAFKKEYISAIDTIIRFYKFHEINKDYIKNVEDGLDAFKERLFGEDHRESDVNTGVLFQAKKSMEDIAQALMPDDGAVALEQSEIDSKLLAIHNLASRTLNVATKAFEGACTVCAPGTVRNIFDTAQILSTENLFENIQTERKNVILELVKEYALINYNSKLRSQAGGFIHDTNLINACMNALSERWGFEKIEDIYLDRNTIHNDDTENLNRILEFAVTEDNITDKLARDYLEKIKASIIIDEDGTVNSISAIDAIEKYNIRYGEHKLTDVFSVDDSYQILGITEDPTAIKVAIAQFISQENKNRYPKVNMYPLEWPEATLLRTDSQGKKLWYSGDLFWIELTGADEYRTIILPSAQDIGMDYIDHVGTSQLQQIINKNSGLDASRVFSQIGMDRLQNMNGEQLKLFLSRLDIDKSIKNATDYVESSTNNEWFEYLSYKNKFNPLFDLSLERLDHDTLAKLSPDEVVMYKLSKEQIRQFFSKLLEAENGAITVIDYVNQYSIWFDARIEEIGNNFLLPMLLDRASGDQLVALSPTHPIMQEVSEEQIKQFFSKLLEAENGAITVIDYVNQNPIWFRGRIEKIVNKFLLPMLLASASGDQLVVLSPTHPMMQKMSEEQIKQFLFTLDTEDKVTNASDYVTKHIKWFKKQPRHNILLPLLLKRLNNDQLAKVSDTVLYKLSASQAEQFFSKLAKNNKDEDEVEKALTYAKDHKKWFDALVEKNDNNPLTTVISNCCSLEELQAVDPYGVGLMGAHPEQLTEFLSKFDDKKENDITHALAYVNKNKIWFDHLVKANDNPLTALIIDYFDGDNLFNLPSNHPALQEITTSQATEFFTALIIKNNNNIDKALDYATNNKQWFDLLVKNNNHNPLTALIIGCFDSDELSKLPSNHIALQEITAAQATKFFRALIGNYNNKIDKARDYATKNKSWFDSLIEKNGRNPLIFIAMEKCGQEDLLKLDPNDIVFKGISSAQAEQFLTLLDTRYTRMTLANNYVSTHKDWFIALTQRTGRNPLFPRLLKVMEAEHLNKLEPNNIALEYLSAEQAASFFDTMSFNKTRPLRVLEYAKTHKEWFTSLVNRIGENPLFPLLQNMPLDQLSQINPKIILQKLSAKQSEIFFNLLDSRPGMTVFGNSLDYIYKNQDWFIKLVNLTGENPIIFRLIRNIPEHLVTLNPDVAYLQGMSAQQARLFFANMDVDESIDNAINYATSHKKWFHSLIERVKENPLTFVMLNRLSSEKLAQQSPEIVLKGSSKEKIKLFLSKMSAKDSSDYITKNDTWFQQQGLKINELLSTLDNPILNNSDSFDIRVVKIWVKPNVERIPDSGTSNFEGQLIIQLENNPLVREAAASLAGKHPESSAIIQLDLFDEGKIAVHSAIRELPRNVRWQVVGHSRSVEGENNHQTLGGRTAETLASQLGNLAKVFNAAPPPKHINLVGCSLANHDSTDSYLHQFALALDSQNMYPETISAYSTKVAVNDRGQKRLTEIGRKIVLTEDEGEWISSSKEAKIEPEGEGRALMAVLEQADQFQTAIKEIILENDLLPENWLPKLDSLQKEGSQHDRYSLTFIQPESATASLQEKTLIFSDPRISDFILQCNKYLTDVKNYLSSSEGQQVPLANENITEVEGVHGLNILFMLQSWFMHKSRNKFANDLLPANLGTALRVHTYSFYLQIGLGSLDDLNKLGRISQEFIQEGAATSSIAKYFTKFSSRVAIPLNLFNIGLDSSELYNAQNEAQRAMFGTQLTFDLSFLGNSLINLGAGMMGATAVAEFSGPLMVPLVGLSIGITDLVMVTQVHIEKTKLVGSFFATLDKGYQQGGYQIANADDIKQKVWRSSPNIAIKTLDLRQKQLTYADTYIYKTQINGIGSGYDNEITMALPQSTKRTTKEVINVRPGINYPSETVGFAPEEDDLIVLPGYPQYYINYHYDTFPFVTSRHDSGFDVLRRLESNYRSHLDNFSFDFYCCPSEYAISDLEFEFISTPVTVLLDDATRTIIMPTQSKEMTDKMAYTLEGGNGTYHINIQQGAELTLTKGGADTHWILDARALGETATLSFTDDGGLQIGAMKIKLSEIQGNLSLVNNKGTYNIDLKNKVQNEMLVDAHGFSNWESLHDHLKQSSHTDSYNHPFVPVDDYLTQEGESVGRAYYEVAQDRFIFTRQPDSADFLAGAQLAKADGNKAWFYNDIIVWQVDIASGEILHEYRTLDYERSATPIKSELTSDDSGCLYFVTEYEKASGTIRYKWKVTEQSMTLVEIDGEKQDIPDINDFVWESLIQFDDVPRVIATLGDEIHQLTRRNGHNYHTWLRKPLDGQQYVSFLNANLGKIAPEDLQPIPIESDNKTSYYFYSRQQQKLYFQPSNGLSNQVEHKAHEVKAGIHSLFAIQSQLIALNDAGILWHADAQGKLQIAGVTSDWLKINQQDIMTQLNKLASTNSTLSVIRLQGLLNEQGKIQMAWYDVLAERVIIADAGINIAHTIHYRGLSADRQHAWLYDENNHLLYRQSLVPKGQLHLNERGQNTVAVPRAERSSPWKYSRVLPSDNNNNLLLITDEGAVLLLSKAAGAQDKPMLIAWQAKELTKELLAAAIESLHDQVILPPAIRLLAEEKGQAPSWYLTEQKTILHARGLVGEHDLHWLGQAEGRLGDYYIHDRTTGDLWLTGASHPIAVGRYSFITQLQGELMMQYANSNQLKDLTLPQFRGVDRLALMGETQAAHYQINASTLNHYRQIIISEQGQQCVIQLPDTLTNLILQSSDQDLVLYDKESNTRIYVANAEQASSRNMTIKIGETVSLNINQLVKEMYRLGAKIPGLNQSTEASEGIELLRSPTDNTLKYRSLSPDQNKAHQINNDDPKDTETNIVNLKESMSSISISGEGGLKIIDNSLALNEHYNQIASYTQSPLY